MCKPENGVASPLLHRLRAVAVFPSCDRRSCRSAAPQFQTLVGKQARNFDGKNTPSFACIRERRGVQATVIKVAALSPYCIRSLSAMIGMSGMIQIQRRDTMSIMSP
jgi:hypothetical protein